MDLTERLAQVVEQGGGAGMGVCSAEPFDDVAAEMGRRVAGGSSAGLTFTYLDPELATDVRRSFPWAERLVVVAYSYLPDAGSPSAAEAGTGRIARFATEDHYVGLREVLGDVAELLEGAGHRAVSLSDDNRLVDRAAAVRAGVGWWGKNAMVLAPGYGPWLLLGSVVTNAELATSPPTKRDCGTCAACMPACPTGALVAPGVLDARRCLARWAQAPGNIPIEFRVAMGDRVYGCDDCLDACPPGGRLLQISTARRGRVDLAAILEASDAEILNDYAHFYLPRRRPSILRRNAIVAMGNSPDGGALGVLSGYLGHPDPMLRAHAAWALGRLGTREADAVLRAGAGSEPDPAVRSEIAEALR